MVSLARQVSSVAGADEEQDDPESGVNRAGATAPTSESDGDSTGNGADAQDTASASDGSSGNSGLAPAGLPPTAAAAKRPRANTIAVGQLGLDSVGSAQTPMPGHLVGTVANGLDTQGSDGSRLLPPSRKLARWDARRAAVERPMVPIRRSHALARAAAAPRRRRRRRCGAP